MLTQHVRCRWDIVNNEGQWDMLVSASRPIAEGEELFLSYDERENEYFFVQYGFVPPRNPHDTVELFKSDAAAVRWCSAQLVCPPITSRPLRAAASNNACRLLAIIACSACQCHEQRIAAQEQIKDGRMHELAVF